MLKNFFLVAVRSLLRHRTFSVINILGLAFGITCAVFAFLVIKFELSYDTFHKNASRIYRINAGGPNDTAEDMDTGSPASLAPVLRSEFPEFDKVGVAYKLNPEQSQVKINNELTRIKELYFVDADFLSIFDFSWAQGNPKTQMIKPNEAAVSQSIADKFFHGDAMGKTLRLNNEEDFVIAGVFSDPPLNSDFPFEVMLSHSTLEKNDATFATRPLDSGWNSYYQTYVLLNSASDASTLRPRLKKMTEQHIGKERADKVLGFAPIALADIHFVNGNFNDRTIAKESIGALSVIGIIILVIACINFTNIATAQAIRRSKEVGIRKTLGTSRAHLVLQFLAETFVVTVVAFVLSIFVAGQLASVSQVLTGIPLSPAGLLAPETVLFMLGVVVVVTLLSGFYPAFVLSGLRPVSALKNVSDALGSKGWLLRKGLIAFQFMVCQLLIVSTFIVIRQVEYFRSKSLGFNKDAVLTVDLPHSNEAVLSTMRGKLLQYPEIKNVSYSLNTPAATINKWWDSFQHHSSPGEQKSVELKIIDSTYIDMFNIEKIAGQFQFSSDTTKDIIVNETFVKEIGIQHPQDAIGETIDIWGGKSTIIGVVKDFQTVTLHQGMHAVLLTPSKKILQKASFKIDMAHADEAIAHVEKHWKEAFPDYYFTYAFLDDSLDTFYREDRKVLRLLTMFSTIAISIGCMGLFGLIMLVVGQRTKEISIRKILGATIGNLITLLSRDFIALIAVASLVAWPIAYYIMSKWLEGFANPISLVNNSWIFLVSGGVSILFSLITVGSQALRAALLNPADTLRSE